MRNLRLGKRDGNNYYLLDGTRMTKQEWIKEVKHQVAECGDQAKLEGLKKVAYRSHNAEDAEEVALFLYVSEMQKDGGWAQAVGYTEETFKGLKEVVGELGEKQIAFF